jgi:hypothetical protein
MAPGAKGSQLFYRGFRLRQEQHLGWSVEPQQNWGREAWESTGFTTPPSSLADVKALIDWRLDQAA